MNTMNPFHGFGWRPVLLGLAAISLLGLAACGSPEPETTNTASGGTAASAPEDGVFRRVDFTLPDLTGEPRRLSEWDGDLILLNFWATWCPPCKEEMPLFQKRYDEYASEGFTIVAVAVDELDETQAFIDSFGIDFPVLIGQEEAIAAGREYGNRIGALPYTVLIDREGMVRETHRGEVTADDLDRWLESHL